MNAAAFLLFLAGLAGLVWCAYRLAVETARSALRRLARREARIARRRAICRSRARLRIVYVDGLPYGVGLSGVLP